MAFFLINKLRAISNYKLRIPFWVILFLTPIISQAQKDKNIIESFEVYTEIPRETTYAHLNKSTYVKGEMMGFTAYVFDKYSKKISTETKNLYCTISNSDGQILKKKLLFVENGIASNVFFIDSLPTGTYTFKAYTNWMKNFDENNHYQQSFKVIDTEDNQFIKPVKFSDLDVDLQVLGEGGHILFGVPNTIGIIAKNNLGYGIPKAKGQILDNNGLVVSEFKLNHVGITKTLFTPEKGKSYTASIVLDEKIISSPITGIKDLGLVLTLKRIREDIVAELLTNESSFGLFKRKSLKVALHNGENLKLTEFQLKDKNAILKFPKEQWFTGINIITVFDEQNRPILERLFFNKEGIKTFQTNLKSKRIDNDSIQLALNLDSMDTTTVHNISISVLPSNTKSYNHQHNIISQTYLRPYVKGTIEKARSYFQNNNPETDFNLDLVMLTQGWSSYDWNKIFNYNQVAIYPFERGIDVVANINGKQRGTYITYPLERSSTQIFTVSPDESQFTIKGISPVDKDLLRIGYIEQTENDFAIKPTIYPQFYPSEFSVYDGFYETIFETFTVDDTKLNLPKLEPAWNNETVEVLDEVVINAVKEQTRAESLREASRFQIKLVTDLEKGRGTRMDIYLAMLGWRTGYDMLTGRLSIVNPRPGAGTPVVYLDGSILNPGTTQNFDVLALLRLGDIDYIEYDKNGINQASLGRSGGFIKIFTDKKEIFPKNTDKTSEYKIPLKFDDDKTFYTPKYQHYNSRFFNEYGTLDWFPKMRFNDKGELDLKIFNTNSNEINLYIEGISEDGCFISEVKTISVN